MTGVKLREKKLAENHSSAIRSCVVQIESFNVASRLL